MSLRLRPMSETEFQRWLTNLVPTYASELEESLRLTPGDAASKAEMDVHGMLPRGLDTPDHWLWIVVDDADGRVGHLWMARMAEGGAARALICDVEIDAPHRGRGLGREAMLLAEQEALARGLQRIDLSVFTANVVARALYRSLGYVETRVQMTKQLSA